MNLRAGKQLLGSRRDDVDRVIGVFRLPIFICAAQFLLMLAGSLVFLFSKSTSILIREKFFVLENYVPMLRRYGAIFVQEGRDADFTPFFSIYSFFVLLQITVLFLLGIILYRNVRGRRIDRFGFRRNVIFALLILFASLPTLDLIFGLSDIERPGFFENGMLYGNYFTAVFVYCLLVPIFNLFIFFLMYGRFWESYFANAAPIGRHEIRMVRDE
jgi:hypothetical protein